MLNEPRSQGPQNHGNFRDPNEVYGPELRVFTVFTVFVVEVKAKLGSQAARLEPCGILWLTETRSHEDTTEIDDRLMIG